MQATMSNKPGRGRRGFVLAALLCLSPGLSLADKQDRDARPSHSPAAPRTVSPHRAGNLPDSAKLYYQSLWGVDSFLVRSTSSGSLIRFSYRVVNPARADVLNDARNTPRLIDPKRGLELTIPTLEKVGELRQKGKPVAGMEYWMMFSNKGLPVKVGDRVNVIIGSFHADGLVVE